MTTRIIQMVGYKSTGAPRFFREVGRMNSFSMRQTAEFYQSFLPRALLGTAAQKYILNA